MNKKITFIITLLCVFIASCSKDNIIVIEIPELSEGEIRITYQDPDMINARTQEEVASTVVRNGKCELTLDSITLNGKIKECTVTIINKEKQFGANLPLFIEKGKNITMKITGVGDYLMGKSILNISYKGSKFAEDFSEFWQSVNDSFMELSQNNNDKQTYLKQVNLYKDFIKEYPESGYAYSVLIGEMQMLQEDTNPIIQYCAELADKKTDNTWQKYLAEAYKFRQMKQITASTLVFSAQDKEGNTITERDVKGKLILVDFWASWCKPCLESIPKLERIYNKYKNNGLTVVSVSLDTNPNDWIKYTKKHPFKWLSLLGNGQEITQRYDFKYIPYIIAADKDGKVIRKGIEIDGLEQFIEQYLNN